MTFWTKAADDTADLAPGCLYPVPAAEAAGLHALLQKRTDIFLFFFIFLGWRGREGDFRWDLVDRKNKMGVGDVRRCSCPLDSR